jgi:hypothetical protein
LQEKSLKFAKSSAIRQLVEQFALGLLHTGCVASVSLKAPAMR